MSDNKLLRKIQSEIAFHSEGTFLNDQNTTKTFRECHAEITRLLAVEVAAKEISDDLIRPHHRDIESDEMLYSCERCSVLHNSSVDFPHGPDCEVLVINPIGDKR